MIRPITPLLLQPELLRERIYPDTTHTHYWSDSWDPDLPMFVMRGEAAADDVEPRDDPRPRRDGVLLLDVVDRRKQPLFGAGVWVENHCVADAAADATVFGLTNARGRDITCSSTRGRNSTENGPATPTEKSQ